MRHREADGPAADLLRHAAAQTRGDLLATRTVPSGGSRAFVDDAKRYLPVVGEDPAAIAAAVLSAGGAGLRSVEDVKVRVAGLGSLGLPRYGIVARTSAEPHGYTLLDVKAAIASCATAAASVPQPPFADEATRIVTIRARAQAAPLATLTALGIGQHPFVMRELQPEEDRIDMTALDSDTAVAQALAAMARAAASAHLHGAGQAGAAPLDTWVAFGRSLDKPALLAAATSAAEGSQADYRTFRQAWDDRDARLPRKRG